MEKQHVVDKISVVVDMRESKLWDLDRKL